MSKLEAPHRLFELPYRMGREFAASLVEDLTERFEAQHQQPLGDPREDLKLLREALFDPVSREERLRRQLDELREKLAWAPPEGTPEVLTLAFGGEAFLVTPEGRLAIEPLKEGLLNEVEGTVTVDELDVAAVEHALVEVYRDWTRYRLARVLSLREGEGKPMLPAAIGTVLFLLINGNVGHEWALAQPIKEDDRDRLEEAVALPIEQFAKAIGGKVTLRHLSFYTGYGLTEARRRFGKDLVLEPNPGGEGGKRVYVASGAETRTVEILARDLRKRSLGVAEVSVALDRFLDAYEERRPRIAAYGVANSKPSRTQHLRRQLLDEL